MQHSTQIPEIEKLQDFNHFVWHCALREDGHELLTLAKIQGAFPALPDYFFPPTYALEFVVKGSIRGTINQKHIELQPGSCALCLADAVLGDVSVSEDCEFYILGLSTQFTDNLNLKVSQNALAQLLLSPTWHIPESQMAIVLQYLDLLRTLIEQQRTAAILNLVRSLHYFLAEDHAIQTRQTHTLSRAEQICGQYLSLVELHCREQHTVEWYASQLHLAPKYLSNVVRKTLSTSPNACIDIAIIRQAKSLLSSTSLSIQQISDLLGFQNQSHFGTFFRRLTGLNPKAFKASAG